MPFRRDAGELGKRIIHVERLIFKNLLENGAGQRIALQGVDISGEVPGRRFFRQMQKGKQACVRLGMDAQVVERGTPGDVTASAWCSFKPNGVEAPTSFVWRLPATPDLGDTAARRTELGKLEQLKTATGTLGDDVMEWAGTHPADPELPWLLHVVVMSTRGGCLDKDASALSRKAHALLHKRWPKSEWARATPYFY